MELRRLGSTEMRVSALGFGAGHVGSPELGDAEAGALLHRVLDAGINLIDAAPSYGAAEERIGRHLQGRRDEFLLSTKCGYGVPGVPDWTPACVTAGIDLALERLRTDHIDVVHFHSCPPEVLDRPGLIEALLRAVEQGKVRAAGYSGDGAALDRALVTGAFSAIQTSVNVFDQRAIEGGVARAAANGLGVIAKRPLANAPWRFAGRPEAHDVAIYWDRMQRMSLDTGGLPWPELALRFVLGVPGVSTCIAGTSRPEHLGAVLRAAEAGPLPPEVAATIQAAFRRCDDGWEGVT